MARRPKTQSTPDAVILPPELDEDDDETVGGGSPDEDGWVWLKDGTKRRATTDGDHKKVRRSVRRRQ